MRVKVSFAIVLTSDSLVLRFVLYLFVDDDHNWNVYTVGYHHVLWYCVVESIVK